MIIIKIKGGLGNQLFQYAFARFLSLQKDIEVKIDNGINTNKNDTYRQYSLNNFNITLSLASREEVLKAKYPLGIISKIWRITKIKILKVHNVGWNKNIINSKESYMDGYWQSYKYLDPIRSILLKEISLKEPIKNKYKELLNQISNTDSVSIHIRRGDYVNDPKTKAAHYTFGLEYYQEAVKIIAGKIPAPTFFVFSDDIEWVKKNFKSIFPTIYVSNAQIKDHEELMIMCECKNNIIANSSFSFWGAWLNKNPNKIVIAPKKWNNIYPKKYKDLLPKEWIQI